MPRRKKVLNTEKEKQGETRKDTPNENATTEKTILDEDTYPFIDKELRGKEDDISNDRDFPPNEIEVITVGDTKENNYEEQKAFEESSTNEKSPANNSITSLTEKEKEQILKLSKQNTL